MFAKNESSPALSGIPVCLGGWGSGLLLWVAALRVRTGTCVDLCVRTRAPSLHFWSRSAVILRCWSRSVVIALLVAVHRHPCAFLCSNW